MAAKFDMPVLTLYSSHCPKCIMIEKLLKENKIPFVLCSEEEVYLPLAQKHGITQMPFAEKHFPWDDVTDETILDCKALQKLITEWGF